MKRLLLFLALLVPSKSFCAMQFSASLQNGTTCQTLGNFGSQIGSGFTVSFWIETSSGGIAVLTVAGFLNTGSATGININLNRGTGEAFEAGSTQLDIRDESARQYGPYIAANNLYDGNWHNVIFVISSPTANSALIYLDGISQPVLSGISQNPSGFANLGFPWDLGTQNSRGIYGGGFNGAMNDFRIYSRSLSSAEAQTIGKSREYVKITDGLVAEWALDDGPNNTNANGLNIVRDSSQNKYTCTPFQNPVWIAGNLNYP